MTSNNELRNQLQWAIEHIENMTQAIELGVNERGQEAIFVLMANPALFDIAEAKALLAQLEEKDCE